jgi:hypothetical protein
VPFSPAPKLRWSAQGRGKRGVARVIRYWHMPGERIYVIHGYVKSERDDLTPQQVRMTKLLSHAKFHTASSAAAPRPTS